VQLALVLYFTELPLQAKDDCPAYLYGILTNYLAATYGGSDRMKYAETY